MKAGIYFTGSGPILVLTSFEELDHPMLVGKLGAKGVDKFVAYEVPMDVVRERYGAHYESILRDVRQKDDLRVLDFNGHRVFHRFFLSKLAGPVYHEPEGR